MNIIVWTDRPPTCNLNTSTSDVTALIWRQKGTQLSNFCKTKIMISAVSAINILSLLYHTACTFIHIRYAIKDTSSLLQSYDCWAKILPVGCPVLPKDTFFKNYKYYIKLMRQNETMTKDCLLPPALLVRQSYHSEGFQWTLVGQHCSEFHT